MWKDNLEKIRQEQKQYDTDINGGISEKEARVFIKKVKKEFKAALPEAYLNVLKVVNGVEYNGFILYGVDESILKSEPTQAVNGFIDNNEILYEDEWEKHYLFLGESSMSLYAYDVEAKKYYELDNPSGDVCEEFPDFEQMFDKLLQDALM